MKKLLVAGGLMACAVFAGRRCKAHCGQFDFEKMIERMPDSSRPKWMFKNISAIRENTERILERLGATEPGKAEAEPPAAAD